MLYDMGKPFMWKAPVGRGGSYVFKGMPDLGGVWEASLGRINGVGNFFFL